MPSQPEQHKLHIIINTTYCQMSVQIISFSKKTNLDLVLSSVFVNTSLLRRDNVGVATTDDWIAGCGEREKIYPHDKVTTPKP